MRFLSTYSICVLLIGMSVKVIFMVLMLGIKFSEIRDTSVTVSAAERILPSALHADRLWGPLSLPTRGTGKYFQLNEAAAYTLFQLVTGYKLVEIYLHYAIRPGGVALNLYREKFTFTLFFILYLFLVLPYVCKCIYSLLVLRRFQEPNSNK